MPKKDLFCTRLRIVREARGYNRTDLGRLAKLHPSSIAHFESGGRKPSFANLIRLADALEVSTDYLMGRAMVEPGITLPGLSGHTDEELVAALGEAIDSVEPPEDQAEVDAYLREIGHDPEEVSRAISAFVDDLIAGLRESAGEGGAGMSLPRFGIYLRDKRVAAGLSLRHVADQLGITHVYLGEVERGVRGPLKRKHWDKLIKVIPGVTQENLERVEAVRI